MGPSRPYLASLSVFPLPRLRCLPKSRRHVCSPWENLSGQRSGRTACVARPPILPETGPASDCLEPPTSLRQPIQTRPFRKCALRRHPRRKLPLGSVVPRSSLGALRESVLIGQSLATRSRARAFAPRVGTWEHVAGSARLPSHACAHVQSPTPGPQGGVYAVHSKLESVWFAVYRKQQASCRR